MAKLAQPREPKNPKDTSKVAPKTRPEYVLARRGNRLILNLVDASDPAYIPTQIIDAALEFVREGLALGDRVLVHCNLGESRSPSIGLLYLAVYTHELPITTLEEAETAFRLRYPAYNPKPGIRGFLQANWRSYCGTTQEDRDP